MVSTSLPNCAPRFSVSKASSFVQREAAVDHRMDLAARKERHPLAKLVDTAAGRAIHLQLPDEQALQVGRGVGDQEFKHNGAILHPAQPPQRHLLRLVDTDAALRGHARGEHHPDVDAAEWLDSRLDGAEGRATRSKRAAESAGSSRTAPQVRRTLRNLIH